MDTTKLYGRAVYRIIEMATKDTTPYEARLYQINLSQNKVIKIKINNLNVNRYKR